ncbi:hypothetical protein [Acetobacter sicerae]|uniref:hypothetical protein n=1 Tax=Acetobacter sicerae TaxID=85325 RepID=UPI00156BAD44|nr:hypothetical protein [Acetobacter sicerae]NHN93861.1 hypothetical protein [Acetobacter sicerae]
MARTREEQTKELTEILYEAGYRFENKAKPEAERIITEAEQRGYERARADISRQHRWFYMVDDPESGHLDMADMLCETTPFEIVETAEAADIRIFFAYQDEDGEVHEFSTRSEAERAARNAIDAAMKGDGNV